MSNDQNKIDILNRGGFINHVVKIVNKIAADKGNMTFAINGDWGCGKTFVLKKIEKQLENDGSKKFLVIPYNCWQYDYYEEPLVAIVAALIDFKDSKNIISKNTKTKLKEIFLNVGLGIATSLLKNKTGIDLSDTRDGLNRARDRENACNFDNYYNFNKALDSLQTALKDISKNYTIVFCVDELDRCLPEYAIKVLERLHHIADSVSNMITIIAFDKERLKNTIGSIFGLENVDSYLRKFIKFEIYLDNGKLDHSQFLQKFSDFRNRFNDNSLWKLAEDKEKQFIEEFLFKDVDIRLQEEIVEEAMTFHDLCFENEKPDYTIMYMELFIVTKSRVNGFNFPIFDKSLESNDILDVITAYRFYSERDQNIKDCEYLNAYGYFGDNIKKLDEFKRMLPVKSATQICIQKQISLPSQSSIKKCAKCGTTLLDDSLYCYSCGRERYKCCSWDGFIDADMNFCPKCGKILPIEQYKKQQTEHKLQEKINKLALECGFTDLPYNFIDRGKYIEVFPPLGNIHMIEKSSSKLLWENARKYACHLEIDGLKNWRIPTIYELEIIYKFKEILEEICKITLKDDWYWSCSTLTLHQTSCDTKYAWVHKSGHIGIGEIETGKEYNVLCVRSIV